MADKLFQIQPRDNAAVALSDIAAGETVTLGAASYTAQTAIPAGHKMAIRPIHAGEDVLKYGFPIGTRSTAICAARPLTDTRAPMGMPASATRSGSFRRSAA